MALSVYTVGRTQPMYINSNGERESKRVERATSKSIRLPLAPRILLFPHSNTMYALALRLLGLTTIMACLAFPFVGATPTQRGDVSTSWLRRSGTVPPPPPNDWIGHMEVNYPCSLYHPTASKPSKAQTSEHKGASNKARQRQPSGHSSHDRGQGQQGSGKKQSSSQQSSSGSNKPDQSSKQ